MGAYVRKAAVGKRADGVKFSCQAPIVHIPQLGMLYASTFRKHDQLLGIERRQHKPAAIDQERATFISRDWWHC